MLSLAFWQHPLDATDYDVEIARVEVERARERERERIQELKTWPGSLGLYQ